VRRAVTREASAAALDQSAEPTASGLTMLSRGSVPVSDRLGRLHGPGIGIVLLAALDTQRS
jgi:hypothetical protein